MIQQESRLSVADNSGAKGVLCIRVLGNSSQDYAKIGDKIVVTVKDAIPAGGIKKEQFPKQLLFAPKMKLRRKDGSYIGLMTMQLYCSTTLTNPVVPCISGLLPRELRDKGYMKIISLAPEVL